MDSNGKPQAGYREVEHTADWELEVWAPDLTGLLEQAALGMYALSGTKLQSKPIVTRSLTVQADDAEEMLVSFLSDLLFLGEDEGLGFDQLQLSIEGNTLSVELTGSPLASQEKEIKAVTFHNLSVKEISLGLKTRIVFDV